MLLFHPHQETLQFLFTFCHKGGVICISVVTDISPGNLDSSLCFPESSVGQESICNAGDPGSIPGLGRSTGEGIGYPIQFSWASY